MLNDTNINFNLSFFENEIIKIEKEKQLKLHAIIKNYKKLVKANVRNLERMIDYEKNKSIIVYNLGLLIELFLKFILLRFGFSNFDELGNYKHNISTMFRIILDNSSDSKLIKICEQIKERASLIKQSDGNKVNYNNYTDFRYNHKKDKLELIFIDDITENDIKYLKEVIECIKLLMK